MRGKRILLGITGGIAAYKIAVLIREFIKNGAEVKCIMTPASCAFISPLTISTLSKNPVYLEYWNEKTGEWTNHVELGLWAEVMIIAPLTANSLAKMAHGLSDNLLLTTYLSARCPVFIAPAMDLDMFRHPSTRRNLDAVQKDGVHILPAQTGELASGLNGEGRMMEPLDIYGVIAQHFQNNFPFKEMRVLVTAGPTFEAIDPVRFIGNHSSGKMGVEIAECLAQNGAQVTLILGPSSLKVEHRNIHVVHVISALEMLHSVQEIWNDQDLGIFSAAVADFKPKNISAKKIKKSEADLNIDLELNPDILAWCGSNKGYKYLLGFAMETSDEEENAQDKLKRKNLDAIVLNSLNDEGAGFGKDTNKITIFDKHNNKWVQELKSKKDVARDIVDFLATDLNLKA